MRRATRGRGSGTTTIVGDCENTSIRCPHDEQNRLPTAFSVAQDGHGLIGDVIESRRVILRSRSSSGLVDLPDRAEVIGEVGRHSTHDVQFLVGQLACRAQRVEPSLRLVTQL